MLFLETMILAVALAAPGPQGCGHPSPSRGSHSGHNSPGQAEPSRPKVRATNTLCPVMGDPVKPGRDREVVIQGGYYLVCCDGCGPKMAEQPDKYLDKDGRPRNAPKDPEGSKAREPEASPKPERSEHQH
jgi:hypothetical protein